MMNSVHPVASGRWQGADGHDVMLPKPSQTTSDQRGSRNMRKHVTVAGLVLAIGIMAAIVAYSPTLYRLFCEATGLGGTTRRVGANRSVKSDKSITVFFDSNIAPGLPWRFRPVQRAVRLHLGETGLAFFEAENFSDHDVVGRATFNVTPEKVGIYTPTP